MPDLTSKTRSKVTSVKWDAASAIAVKVKQQGNIGHISGTHARSNFCVSSCHHRTELSRSVCLSQEARIGTIGVLRSPRVP